MTPRSKPPHPRSRIRNSIVRRELLAFLRCGTEKPMGIQGAQLLVRFSRVVGLKLYNSKNISIYGTLNRRGTQDCLHSTSRLASTTPNCMLEAWSHGSPIPQHWSQSTLEHRVFPEYYRNSSSTSRGRCGSDSASGSARKSSSLQYLQQQQQYQY